MLHMCPLGLVFVPYPKLENEYRGTATLGKSDPAIHHPREQENSYLCGLRVLQRLDKAIDLVWTIENR